MFYTKYRPQTFSEISRPNEAADALATQVRTNKTVHAYLFIGPRGTGKTTTARILAKALNCKKVDKKGDPCDKCDTCESIKKGIFTDLIEIDAASNRGIDDIRDLQDKIGLAPSQGKVKVYIVDEVHMLTPQAFNALLKTLEEPPKNVVFILCTTESHKVPETIKSRCQIFKFKRATTSQLVKKLDFIAKKEGAKLSKDQLEKIASAALGGFRDSENLLQQVIEGEVNVDLLLDVSSKETILDFVGFLSRCDAKGALDIISDAYEKGIDLYVWSGEVLKYVRDLLLYKATNSASFLDVSEDLMKRIKDQAENMNISWLVRILNIFSEAQPGIKKAFIPQLPLEVAVVELCGGVDESLELRDLPEPKVSPDQERVYVQKKKEDLPAQVEKPKKPPKNAIKLEAVIEKWEEFLERTKDVNGPIAAMLKTSKPVDISGKFIVLEVYFAFHKERLESMRNREIVGKALNDVYKTDLNIECVVCKEKLKRLGEKEVGILTDINVVPVSDNISPSSIMESFDGGLPL